MKLTILGNPSSGKILALMFDSAPNQKQEELIDCMIENSSSLPTFAAAFGFNCFYCKRDWAVEHLALNRKTYRSFGLRLYTVKI